MPSTPGAWDGIDINEEHIDVLRHHRKFSLVELDVACVPGTENSPTPRDAEVVVFDEHFARGLGLPASHFFFGFLMHYSVQPYHLGPNAVLQLAGFVTLCEGFLGIEPRLDLWCRLFFFKQWPVKDKATGEMRMTPCGAALVYHRFESGFPQLPLQDLVKN
ncbi:hypothetical protein D1007_05455 [Hordeum vulgare]|nr:hypothetical protein D1007_05455 [Hordeum vulgare]